MNIFYLHDNPEICAQYHADKHVVKQILECAQILSTVLEGKGTKILYKPTHKNHPVTLWVGESWQNFSLTVRLFKALCKEYTFRYGKTHKCETATQGIDFNAFKPLFDEFNYTRRPICTGEHEVSSDEALEAYREYYIDGKRELLNYTKRDIPLFIKEQMFILTEGNLNHAL